MVVRAGRLDQTIADSRKVTAERKLSALLDEQGAVHGFRDSRLEGNRPESLAEEVDKAPQVNLGIFKMDGTVVILPWITFQKGILHVPDNGSNAFVELIFSFDNVLVFGRGMEEFLIAFLKFQAVTDIVEQEADHDDGTPFFVSEILVVSCGRGNSLFSYDSNDLAKLSSVLVHRGMSVRPELLDDMAAGLAVSQGSGKVVIGEGELAGHPVEVEDVRRGVQHQHLREEKVKAKKEGRKIDPSAFRH